MDRITKKLMKYFISIITIVVVLCFIMSSIFLSGFYIRAQYKNLKNIAQEIYTALKSGTTEKEIPISPQTLTSAVLIKGNSVYYLGHSRIEMMPFFRKLEYSNLQDEGRFKDNVGGEFLYYKLNTDIGEIVVIQDNKYSSDYLNIVYIILCAVFLMAIVLSAILISFLGKKFTKPILKLQKASYDIAQGNFNIDTKVDTKDEIEDLSNSINAMAVKLEKKYAIQRDFIANVSHDFKTPLSIIRNYSEAIQDGIIDEENTKEYSKEIIREVDRLNSLVISILQLSKLQGGGYILKKEYFQLEEFLTDCCNRFSYIATQKNIELQVTSPKVEVYADSDYLYRVVYNFIDNALKYGFPNTKTEVSALMINEDLKISVKNIGIGIEKGTIEDVWSRYYKQNKSGGMGLGLAICGEILKLHEFTYGVVSVPSGVTDFYFIIPGKFIRNIH